MDKYAGYYLFNNIKHKIVKFSELNQENMAYFVK